MISAETSQEKILGDADTAVVNSMEIMREATVTIEGLMNTQMKAFQTVQEKLNTANDNAIDSMENFSTVRNIINNGVLAQEKYK